MHTRGRGVGFGVGVGAGAIKERTLRLEGGLEVGSEVGRAGFGARDRWAIRAFPPSSVPLRAARGATTRPPNEEDELHGRMKSCSAARVGRLLLISPAVTASRSALPGGRGNLSFRRFGSSGYQPRGNGRLGEEPAGGDWAPETRCPGMSYTLSQTVLRRLWGQVDKAQGDSKMRRERAVQGWPGTRFPEGDALFACGLCTWVPE
jgi:hypothetical protein